MKGKIEKIEIKSTETKYGVKDFALITISGKVVSTFKKDQIEELTELGEGSIIDYIVEENKKGDKIYLNLIGFEPIEKVNQKQENLEPKKEVDWDAKDRRVVRENAMRQANSLLSTLQAGDRLKDLTNEQVRELLFKVAELCEEWVYRK